MKHVTIIYRNDENTNAIAFIKANLEETFGQYITFSNCYLQNLTPGTKLHADAYLAVNEQVFQDAKEYVDDFRKMIKIKRSPDRSALNTMSKIVPGTTVLIVNDSYDSSLDTTQSFYEAGIGHINMEAYDSSLAHTGIYNKIEVAITPAEPHLVPPHIQKVYDIGYRKISFETMFKLMKMLDLDVAIVNRNLFRHIHSIVESTTSFHDSYIFGYLKSEMLTRIVSTSKIGMMLVDSYYEVVYINDRASQILQRDNKSAFNLSDYIDLEILTSDSSINGPIKILADNYYYDKYAITLMDEVAGYYITLQDEDAVDIASKAMREKGFTAKHQFKDIIHTSASMEKLIQTARQIALTDHTVLIQGESGTGKELIAQSIHNASYRNKHPFVAINCAALPDSLLESELFGYEPGAFTGAQSKGKPGLFEEANYGTIFLDEVGDISPKLQARLLRTIQERQIMRVGSDRLIDVDFRLITATNRDLEAAVREGKFRSDLFFRLNVLPVVLPPLRKRKEDILPLLQHFLGSSFKNIPESKLRQLMSYSWPGNVRELENMATYYQTLSDFPPQITEQSDCPAARISSADANVTILKIIAEHTQISHGIGRSSLTQLLKSSGLNISEGKLREILEGFIQQGWIQIGKGRYGTRITEKGIAALEEKEV